MFNWTMYLSHPKAKLTEQKNFYGCKPKLLVCSLCFITCPNFWCGLYLENNFRWWTSFFFQHPHEEYIKFFLLSQPGDTKSVILVRIGGKQIIRGGNNIADGPVDHSKITSVMKSVHEGRYGFSEKANARSERSCFFMKCGIWV